ncbi:uncharacterized protein LOC117781435 [Drosophila innubila]|uniref:uncharacterized protein LOC117781435 n=1 Tax=Drosophila innubila TaxID=198719 RepID=UPI00148D48C6|nr:uncharacterized protein LOC117781435 [Drosophila innubila]
MKTEVFVLIVFLGAVSAADEQKAEKELGDSQILFMLEDNNKTLENLDKKAHGISNTQKGIESKLKSIGQELAVIGHVEDGLKKLETLTANNLKTTTDGIMNLTSTMYSAGNRTDRAINGLVRSQQEIKLVLIQVDANQSKYERDLNEVAKSVHNHIAGLDTLLKQSVLKELVTLGQTAKKLESSQKHIERKIGYLDELAALGGITANKVQLLEQGLRSLNISQQLQLSAIGETVHQVGSTTWQIDNKLGVLLSTQKNIERALEECKKCRRHHYGKDHYDEPKQPQEHYADPSYDYGHKDTPKSSLRSDYGSYSNAEETSSDYQLWYGKD